MRVYRGSSLSITAETVRCSTRAEGGREGGRAGRVFASLQFYLNDLNERVFFYD